MCYNTSSNNHLELLFNRDLYGVYLSRLVDTIQVKNTMQKEIWLPVQSYEGLYEVSNMGKIRNKFRLMKLHLKNNGYVEICLSKNRNKKFILVHRLVAQHFIPNLINGLVVNHKDFNKQNNSVENLEWCTQRQNIDHCMLGDHHLYGTRNGNHRLEEKQILEIRNSNLSLKDASTFFKVSTSTIWVIRTRKTWKHI